MQPPAWSPVSRRVGQTGMAVYPLALDGSVFGWASDVAESREMLDRFTEIGGNVISTADHYAGGRSETMIGSWLRSSRRRDRLVIATKVGRHPEAMGLSAASIRRAVHNSLERLGADYIDVLSFDGDDPDTPLEESLTAAAELAAAGVVHHLSVAAWSGEQVRQAISIARRLEVPGISIVVVEYNLIEREPYESDIAPVALSQDLGVLVRLPLANGYLRGDFRSRHDRPSSPLFAGALRYVGRRGAHVLATLDDISAETGDPVGQIALAWLLAQPLVSAPIVRVPDARSLLDLVPALDIVLAPKHMERLDQVSRSRR